MTKHQTTEKRSAEALRFSFSPKPAGRKLLRWYQKNARPHPWRQDWQETKDPWVVWVSEIMLQQTVIKAVLPVYKRFMTTYPNCASMAAADEESVRRTVRGLGYYRRFGLLHRAAKQLTAESLKNSKVQYPKSFADWKALPGVGDYTAAAISSICFDQPVGVVDGNVERVLCRLLDLRCPPNDPKLKKPFKGLVEELLPPSSPGDFNQGLMELGQRLCTPTNPDCDHCPLQGECLAFERKSQALAPAPKAKVKPIEVRMQLQVVRKKQEVLLIKRPTSAKFLKETWGFPTAIEAGKNLSWDGELVKTSPQNFGTKVGEIRHSITKHKISATVLSGSNSYKIKTGPQARWVCEDDVDEQLVSNLDRKAWHLVQKSAKAYGSKSAPA